MVEKTQKEIMIIGSEGLLGRALLDEASKSFDVACTTIDQLDITDSQKVQERISSLQPRVIVVTAAYTDVDGCEENPSLARSVNVEGVKNVAEAASRIKAAVIFLSSDYVFNGRATVPYKEEDSPDPISVYGQTKLEAERILQAILAEHVIVRSTWLFGEGKNGFVQFVLNSIAQRKPMKIVADKFGSPTYVFDLSQAICQITKLILNGSYDFQTGRIVHITNSGICTWFEMAKFILDVKNSQDIELTKINLADYPFKARRPQYSGLDNSKFAGITGKPLRPWQEALKEFVECQKG